MAKTVNIVNSSSTHFTCAQCGTRVSSGDGKILQFGLLGLGAEGPFCCGACAAAYARDRGWVVK